MLIDKDLSFLDKTNITWLKSNTIYVTIHGSHAYGTAVETSDIDYRGICIAPIDYYFGFSNKLEQAVFKDPDAQIFEIKKFFALAAAANPNALEIIFTDPKFHLMKQPIFDIIYQNRHKFLSKRANFSMKGYAKAQLQRLKSRYDLFNNPITEYPKRSDFDLPDKSILDREHYMAAESIIQKKLDSWNPDLSFLESDVRKEIEQKITEMLTEIGAASIYIEKNKLWLEAALVENIDVNVILAIKKEKEYNNKVKQYNQYKEWKKNRNEKRAVLEEKYNYDTKFALHLIRLLSRCYDLLTTGELIVNCPDAKHLIDIRNGKYTYDELMSYAKELEDKVNDACLKTSLPEFPDINFLNDLCTEIIMKFHQKI